MRWQFVGCVGRRLMMTLPPHDEGQRATERPPSPADGHRADSPKSPIPAAMVKKQAAAVVDQAPSSPLSVITPPDHLMPTSLLSSARLDTSSTQEGSNAKPMYAQTGLFHQVAIVVTSFLFGFVLAGEWGFPVSRVGVATAAKDDGMAARALQISVLHDQYLDHRGEQARSYYKPTAATPNERNPVELVTREDGTTSWCRVFSEPAGETTCRVFPTLTSDDQHDTEETKPADNKERRSPSATRGDRSASRAMATSHVLFCTRSGICSFSFTSGDQHDTEETKPADNKERRSPSATRGDRSASRAMATSHVLFCTRSGICSFSFTSGDQHDTEETKPADNKERRSPSATRGDRSASRAMGTGTSTVLVCTPSGVCSYAERLVVADMRSCHQATIGESSGLIRWHPGAWIHASWRKREACKRVLMEPQSRLGSNLRHGGQKRRRFHTCRKARFKTALQSIGKRGPAFLALATTPTFVFMALL